MISVVTAYYNRKRLFVRTLESMQQYVGQVDFEVVAVDDGSTEDERLEDLIEKFPFLRVIRLEPTDKWYSNPCIPFNIGFEHALGTKIILQNPECFHFDNILGHVNTHLKQSLYLSFACFSLDKESTDDETLFRDRVYLTELMQKNPHVVFHDGGMGWYNHSKYRPAGLHFCTAITVEDLVDLGGFDPRYALGHGYDDDELIFRIRQKNMKVKFVDDIKVLHQNHYKEVIGQKEKYRNKKAERNKSIFDNITRNSIHHRANYLEIREYAQKPVNSFNKIFQKIKTRIV